MAGRPSKLSQKLIEDICNELAQGLPVITTCDLFGITTMSFSNWSRKGEEDYNNDIESIEAEFFYRIKKAKAEFERKAREKITKGEPGWQGMAWWLERTRPQYTPKQEITAGSDGKVTVVLGGKVKDVKQG